MLTGLDKNGGGVVQYTLTRTKQRDKNMRHDEERDNTTDIENQIIEADKRAREESAPYPPAYPFPVFGRPGGELVKSWDDPEDPEHDPIGDAETEYDIEYDDGQPSEYVEWQDFMGGDEDYDHSENACW